MVYWRDIHIGLPVTWETGGVRARITSTNPAFQTVTVQLTQPFVDYSTGLTLPRGHTVRDLPHTILRVVT